MIMNMFVHTAYQRAQCEVYLRAKGIKPPDYTFELRRDSLTGCPYVGCGSSGIRG